MPQTYTPIAGLRKKIDATSGAILDIVDQNGDSLGLVSGAGLSKLVGDQVAASSGTPTSAVGAAGSLTGAYYYTVTFVTAQGETAPWPGTATVVNPSSQQVNLTSIPIGPAGTTARRIYRTPATPTDPKDYRFLVEISDNTTTTYTDNTADGSLGSPANWNATNRGVVTDGSVPLLRASDQSTGVGYQAFNNNVGYASTAVGYQSLYSCTTGRRNVAVGTYSLTTLTTGYENVGAGTHAGQSITTGIQNTLLGYSAGFNVTTQGGNTFVGNSSGSNAGLGGTSQFNTALGRDSLRGTASGLGQLNVGIGYFALRDINTADQCAALGPYAGRYANASRQLFVDTGGDRTNIANCQNIGLIYGKGETTAAAQVLHLNAQVRIGAGDAPVVAGLPAAASGYKGYRGYVTDATVAYTSANVGSTVAGGGSNTVPVFCNGTNWVIG
jgi:hypothetical protein